MSLIIDDFQDLLEILRIYFKANSVFGFYLKRGRDVTEWVADQLQAGQESGQISDEDYINVIAADHLWGGKLRRDPEQTEVVLVIEASWRVEPHDVDRAVSRAAILRRLGIKALPVVAGQEWTAGVLEMARRQGAALTENGRVDDASWQAALAA